MKQTKSIIFLFFAIIIVHTDGIRRKRSKQNIITSTFSATFDNRKTKYVLNTTLLNLFYDVGNELEIELHPYFSGRTLFKANPEFPLKNNGFFHGTCCGDMLTINIIQSRDHKIIIGSLTDSEQNQIYSIETTLHGEVTLEPKEMNKYFTEEKYHNHSILDKAQNNSSVLNRKPPYIPLMQRNANAVVDVMVIWTKQAECGSIGLPYSCKVTGESQMEKRIELAIQETNVALRLSRCRVQLRLVHSYRVALFAETTKENALFALYDKDDGFLDDVSNVREEFGADIVSLWIHSDGGCGVGFIGPGKEVMINVVDWGCSTNHFTFAHEIGHNLGCNHDRGSLNECDSDLFNYGYRDPNARFRDVMAYNCKPNQCDNNMGSNCVRALRYSNIVRPHLGLPLGTPASNCARAINTFRFKSEEIFPALSEEKLVILRKKFKGDNTSSAPVIPCKGRYIHCPDDLACCSKNCYFHRCL